MGLYLLCILRDLDASLPFTLIPGNPNTCGMRNFSLRREDWDPLVTLWVTVKHMLHDALAAQKARPEVAGAVLCSGVSLFRILSLRYDMISRFYLSLSAPDGEKVLAFCKPIEFHPSSLFSRVSLV